MKQALIVGLWLLAGCAADAPAETQIASAPTEMQAGAAPPLALGFRISRTPIVVTDIAVYDGDTFDVGNERFRPYNIDTPELGHRAHCQQEAVLAEQARAVAQEVFDAAATVTLTPTHNRRDPYGRVRVRVDVDGRDFAAIMQERGVAQAYLERPGWNWCTTPVSRCAENSAACGRG